MKKTSFIILLLLSVCWGATQAQELKSGEEVTEKIREVKKMPQDTVRMQLLFKLYQESRNSTPHSLRFLRQMIADARQLGYRKFEYQGRVEQILYFQGTLKLDSVEYYYNRIRDCTRQDTTAVANRSLFVAWNLYVSTCISLAKLELGRIQCYKMEKEALARNYPQGLSLAYSRLGEIYRNYHQTAMSRRAYEKALGVGAMDVMDRASIYAHIGETALSAENYAEAASFYEKAIETYLSPFPADKVPPMLYDVLTYNASFAAFCHMKDKRLDRCKYWLEQAERFYSEDRVIGAFLYYHIYKGLYEAELNHYDLCMEQFRVAEQRKDIPFVAYIIQDSRIRALLAMQRYEEVIPLLRAFVKLQDEQQKVWDADNRAAMMQNIRWTAAEMEHARIMRYTNLFSVIFVSVLFLLILYATLHLLHSRWKLKTTLEQLKKAEENAQSTDKMKESFIRNISHDVRVPLGSIIGFSQQLSMDLDLSAEERQEIRGILKENSDRLMNLVNNVLDLSRLESGKMKYQIAEFDLVETCKLAAFQINSRDDKRCCVTFDTACTGKIFLKHDSQRMLKTLISALQIPLYVHLPEGMEHWDEQMTLVVDTDVQGRKYWVVTVTGSPLSAVCMESEEQSMLNTICRLYMKVLGASCEVMPGEKDGKVVFKGELPGSLE